MSLSSQTDKEATFVKTTFTSEEESFLEQFIPAWRAKYYGDQAQTRKGQKKIWVQEEPYPKFIRNFYEKDPVKPNGGQLREKIYRWFLNRATDGPKTPPKARTKPEPELKRPRAMHAFQVFAEEKKAEIVQLGREKSNKTSPPHNLSFYKESSKELWDALSDASKEAYVKKASEKNELIKKGPTEKDIEKNQARIMQNTLISLSKLTGYHWTGHGDAAFFVMGAYRQVDGGIKTFYGSVLEDDQYATKGFHRNLPNFKSEIRERFKAWAEDVIPGGKKGEPGVASSPTTMGSQLPDKPIPGSFDGYPIFPALDLEKVNPESAKSLLQLYMAAAWKHFAPGMPIPWECLGSSDRTRILLNHRRFAQFESLDPRSASAGDTYLILETIIKEQKEGRQPLQFHSSRGVVPTESAADPWEDVFAIDQHQRDEGLDEQVDKVDFSPPRPRALSGRPPSSPSPHQLAVTDHVTKTMSESWRQSRDVLSDQDDGFEMDDGEVMRQFPDAFLEGEGESEADDRHEIRQPEGEAELLSVKGGKQSRTASKKQTGQASGKKRKHQPDEPEEEDEGGTARRIRQKPQPASTGKKTNKKKKGAASAKKGKPKNNADKGGSGAGQKKQKPVPKVKEAPVQRKNAAPLPPKRDQSARIHSKEYKNTRVTIYS